MSLLEFLTLFIRRIDVDFAVLMRCIPRIAMIVRQSWRINLFLNYIRLISFIKTTSIIISHRSISISLASSRERDGKKSQRCVRREIAWSGILQTLHAGVQILVNFPYNFDQLSPRWISAGNLTVWNFPAILYWQTVWHAPERMKRRVMIMIVILISGTRNYQLTYLEIGS